MSGDFTARGDPEVDHLGDVPVCPGCGLMAHITHGDICQECFQRREGWCGGGPIRAVTQSRTYHETGACPGVRSSDLWWHWRDEECMYADLAGDMDKCRRCHSHRLFGFDYYRGDQEAPIGHA